MLKRSFVLFLFILFGPGAILRAQTDDLCEGLNKIITSGAQNSFTDIKDSTIKANQYAIMWSCKVNMPGAIRSRLVSSMGIRYEAAMFQAKEKEALKGPYNKYKARLKECLEDKGYKLSKQDNFYEGLGDYKKLVYIKNVSADTSDNSLPPPHVSLEVDHFKGNGSYSIILNVWEH